MGGDEKNRPKRRKTRHLGHRYVNFLPSFNLLFCFFYRFYSCSKTTGRIRLGSDEKNRPKRRVLHHLGHRYVVFFLFMFYLFFFVFLGSICVLKRRAGLGWAAMRKTGPNDAKHIVWAIGMFLFYSSCFLCTNYFL